MMSPVARLARTCRRTVRRVGVAAFAWLVAVVVLAGVARAGSSFVYCHLMDAVRAECCCVQSQDDAVDLRTTDGPVVDMGCCDKGTVASLPTAAVAPAYQLPRASLATVLPSISAVPTAFALRAPLRPPTAERSAMPPPPTAAASCARLSVFLI